MTNDRIELPFDKFNKRYNSDEYECIYWAEDIDLGDKDFTRNLIKNGFILDGYVFTFTECSYLLNDFLDAFEFEAEGKNNKKIKVTLGADDKPIYLPDKATQYTRIYEEYDWRKENHIQTENDWYSGN